MDFESVLNLGVEKEIINETQKNSLIDLFYQNENEPVGWGFYPNNNFYCKINI